MGKFGDWGGAPDVKEIMEKFLEQYPTMFEGFNTDSMFFFMTQKKKSKEPIKVHAVGYPNYAASGKPYIVEVFEVWWKAMNQKKKNLAVFRAMCSIPDGGFDEKSKYYGKKLQPSIKMYMREYAACGAVVNWMENPAAKDPMERTADEVEDDVPDVEAIPKEDDIERNPVTQEDIEAVA